MSHKMKLYRAVAFSLAVLFSCSTANAYFAGPCSGRFGNLLFAEITNTGSKPIVVFPVDGWNPATDGQYDPYGFVFGDGSGLPNLWTTTTSQTSNGMQQWQKAYTTVSKLGYYFWSLEYTNGANIIDNIGGGGDFGGNNANRITNWSAVSLNPQASTYLLTCGETGTVLGAAETGTAGEVFINFQTMLNISNLRYIVVQDTDHNDKNPGDPNVSDITMSVLGPNSNSYNPSVGDLRSPPLTTPFVPYGLMPLGLPLTNTTFNSIAFSQPDFVSAEISLDPSFPSSVIGINLLGANAIITPATPGGGSAASNVNPINLSNDESLFSNPSASYPYVNSRDVYSSPAPGIFAITINGQPGANPLDTRSERMENSTGTLMPESDFAMIVQVNLNLDNDNAITKNGVLVPNSNPNGMFANSAPYGFGAGD
jgi:hypothetical protein